MSQAQIIYDILSTTPNQAAEKALLLGLPLAEEPYGMVIMETLLERGDSRSGEILIESYHIFKPKWQELIHRQVNRLYSGLRRAGKNPNIRTRLNLLTIIRKSRYSRLADMVVLLLHDNDPRVARMASTVLLELAKGFIPDISGRHAEALIPAPEDNPVGQKIQVGQDRENIQKGKNFPEKQIGQDSQTTQDEQGGPNQLGDITYDITDRQIMSAALQSAVSQYKKFHQRDEAILAGMYFAPAYWSYFWNDYFEPYHPVGKIVRYFMLNYDMPELATFCLSALKHPELRATAIRAISQNHSKDFLLALARIAGECSDRELTEGLANVHEAAWLNRHSLSLEKLSAQEQEIITKFIRMLGLPSQGKIAYIIDAAEHLSESVLLEVIEMTADVSLPEAEKCISRLLSLPSERVSLVALAALMKRNSPRLPRIMAEQLRSRHPQVRRLAEQYYRRKAFVSYWQRFDQMPAAQRIKAGQAVLKLDPQAEERWCRMTASRKVRERLRALMILRQLGLIDKYFGLVCQLTKDHDAMVRSCAAAALGEIKQQSREVIRKYLDKLLLDEDDRVKANAIEALERQGLSQDKAVIATLVNHRNNRVRANSIKALLNWKVVSANQAVQAMLKDLRANHRQSGSWLAKTAMSEAGEGLIHEPAPGRDKSPASV